MAPRLVGLSAFVTAALLSFFASCGPTSTCATTCTGCCDAMGQCVTATSTAACGANGATCSACTRSEACSNGACVAVDAGSTDAGACANCRGCCQNGVCRTGNLVNACGADGGTCEDCTVGNRACVANACRAPCGPSNCQGCCRNDVCITSTTVQACGAGGQACVFCGSGQVCQAGLCTTADGGSGRDGGESCAATCNGCCDATDMCQPGLSNLACGNLGARCVVCNGTTCRDSPTTGGGRCF
ncbi:MAG: hypothetical protein MUC96_32340 [Myxococcaceae bacterium]|jgi:hypothetical protein|nr:hypothetical protein [Myxococcaceae bacterium]